MWANKAWIGRWFPHDTPSGSELSVYRTWCNAVEGNTTFYALPKPTTIDRWREQAADDFRFCFKLPRTITHDRRLQRADSLLDDFLRRITPLASWLGPIQIQLPAAFGPDDFEALSGFLSRLPMDFTWAVEVRHPAFFEGGAAERPLNDLLASLTINRVILDSRSLFSADPRTAAEIDAWQAKPRLPVRPVATGTAPVVRLIGHTEPTKSLDDWSQWYPKLAQWIGQGLRPHVFTHTPDNLDAPELARRVWQRVNAAMPAPGPTLQPLPEPVRAGRQLQVDF